MTKLTSAVSKIQDKETTDYFCKTLISRFETDQQCIEVISSEKYRNILDMILSYIEALIKDYKVEAETEDSLTNLLTCSALTANVGKANMSNRALELAFERASLPENKSVESSIPMNKDTSSERTLKISKFISDLIKIAEKAHEINNEEGNTKHLKKLKK